MICGVYIFHIWNKKNVSRDIHLMLFHPGFPPSEETEKFLTDNDWESDVDDDYMMVFIQSLSALNKARGDVSFSKLGYTNKSIIENILSKSDLNENLSIQLLMRYNLFHLPINTV